MEQDPLFLPRPTRAQMDWQDMELGMFIHWFPIYYEEFDEARAEDPAYRRELVRRVDCAELDARQWVQSAVDLGAKYIVFVAKHGMGLCLWRSEHGDFSITQSPYAGDPLAELSKACQEQGIKLGVYLAGTSYAQGAGNAGRAYAPEKQAAYDALYRAWLTELLSRYGEMVEVWFDGSLIIEVGDILKKYAPNAMIFQSKYATIRWVGQEEGYASDPAWNGLSRYDAISGVATQRHGDPEADAWMPLECDARIRQDWGWADDLERNRLRSLNELMGMYYRSVGHGAVLLLNQAPNPKGRIIEEDMARMKAFGDEIRRRFATPVAQTSGRGMAVELTLPGLQPIDHVILQEDIRHGERVRVYALEGYDGTEWKRLCAGAAIGHKKIDYFQETAVSALRLRVLASVGEPQIRSLAAYHVGETPAIAEAPARGIHKLGEWGTEMYDLYTFEAHFQYPINAYVDDAGQYRVYFTVTRDVTPLRIQKAWLEMDGVASEAYVTPVEGENAFDVYVGGVGETMVFHALSAYDRTPALAGEVYIQRLS